MGWIRSFRFEDGKVSLRSGDMGTETYSFTPGGVHFIKVFKDFVSMGYLIPGKEADDLLYEEFTYTPPIQRPILTRRFYARSKKLRERLATLDSVKDLDELLAELEEESQRREECIKEMRVRLPRGAPVDEECVIQKCLRMTAWREAFQECLRE